MKNFMFLGCCVISLGIVIAGVLIASKILPVSVPGSMTLLDSSQEPGDFLAQYDAAAYLKIDYDQLVKMVESGDLSGTYADLNGNHVFSKEKLTQWMNEHFES